MADDRESYLAGLIADCGGPTYEHEDAPGHDPFLPSGAQWASPELQMRNPGVHYTRQREGVHK